MIELAVCACIFGAGIKAALGGGNSRKSGRRNSNYKDAMGWSHTANSIIIISFLSFKFSNIYLQSY